MSRKGRGRRSLTAARQSRMTGAMTRPALSPDIAVIGGGPAGLAAAEAALGAGRSVTVFDARPSLARKFLMAGKSGLNLSNDLPPDLFRAAFPPEMHPFLAGFTGAEARAWAEGLGEEMFIGSSRRLYPVAMKASPLLRRWLVRLSAAEVRTKWRWTGWDGEALMFDAPDGPQTVRAKATVLAMGGGSWPRLGSDGAWMETLRAAGVGAAPLRPANMGFDVGWSDHMTGRFAGAPVKTIAMTFGDTRVEGEFTITRNGVEGGVIYTLSAPIRDALEKGALEKRAAIAHIDLTPGRGRKAMAERLSRPRGKLSASNFLRKAVGLTGVKAALLRECAPDISGDPYELAAVIKALPLQLAAPRPIEEAISTAGGVAWDALTSDLMLVARPGVFAAGEMLDWEAPTGGYLLTGCLATGFAAGQAAASHVSQAAE